MYRVLGVFALVLITLFATKLRLDSSESRLAHADEGEQAYTFIKLYTTNSYEYNPNGAHGATLYYWTYICKKAEGLFREPKIDIESLRATLVPIFLLSILAFFALRRELGISGIIFSVTAWGVSALSVLYSLYFVQEIFFTVAVFLAMSYLYLAITRQRTWDFAILGIACGFAQASKETFVIVLIALFLPSLGLVLREKLTWKATLAKKILLSLACGLGVCLMLYSSFGANPRGVLDAMLSYLHFFDKAQSVVHSKEFLYYAKILFMQKSQGVYFGEFAISFFAIVGGIIGYAKGDKFIKYIAEFCLAYFLIMSLIPYKTPWLLLSLIMPMCLLFGYTFSVGLKSKHIIIRVLAILLLLGTLYLKLGSTKIATQRFANDPRNSLTYVHTTSHLKKLLSRIESIKTSKPNASVSFYTTNSPFPIPYYLIKYKNITYNTENFKADIIAIDDPKLGENIDKELYDEEFYGLRENLIIYTYIKKDIFKDE